MRLHVVDHLVVGLESSSIVTPPKIDQLLLVILMLQKKIILCTTWTRKLCYSNKIQYSGLTSGFRMKEYLYYVLSLLYFVSLCDPCKSLVLMHGIFGLADSSDELQ